MGKNEMNAKVFAKEADNGWFNIYISCSGKNEFVMTHRRNDRIYELLRNGVMLNELQHMKKGLRNRQDETMERFSKGDFNHRFKAMRNRQRKNENSLEHIIVVIREYLYDRFTSELNYQVA